MKDNERQTCDNCDGCGWYEGGKTLQTKCEKCNGTGVVPPQPEPDLAERIAERALQYAKKQVKGEWAQKHLATILLEFFGSELAHARAAQPQAEFDEDKFLLQITNDISYENRFHKGPIWLALTIMQRVAALLGKEGR